MIDIVKILIRNDEGQFLILKKASSYDGMSDKWEQPGGSIEDDEDRFEAARREIKEETDLEISEFEDLVRLELETSEKINCFVMYAESFSGSVEISEEHQDWRWIDRKEALELDWHRDAAYIIPVIMYLEDYLESERDYGSGEEIDVVKLLIENEEGKFLAMQKTAEDKIHSGHSYTLYGRMAGKWELPGGTFEDHEDRFEASRREAKEEVGIELGEVKDVVREEIEEENKINTYIIYCDEWNGEVEASKEHQDYRWVSAEEYKNLNWHQDAGYGYPPMKFLRDYLNRE